MPDNTPSQRATQTLVNRARLGDHTALGDLLGSQQHRIYNVVLRMVSHRDDAAEITQETMLKIVEHIGQFRGDADFTTWAMRIAMNLSYSQLRKRRVRQAISLDTPAGAAGGPHDDQLTPLREQIVNPREPGPAARVQMKEMAHRLQTAMDNLQDDLRAVLVLRDIDEMDYEQIAAALEVPLGTVKSRLFRARLAMREELAQMGPIPPQGARQNRPTPQPASPTPPRGPGGEG